MSVDVQAEFAAHLPSRRRRWPWIVPLILLGFVLAWAVLVRVIFSAYSIPTSAMEPTIDAGDTIIANSMFFDGSDAEPGDVVVMEPPSDVLPDVDLIVKRVVAVGGDSIEIRGGRVLVNGDAIEEPYVGEVETIEGFQPDAQVDPDGDGVAVVPEGMAFVMGDNRMPAGSMDSRYFGFVPTKSFVARVFGVKTSPITWTSLDD